MNVEKTVHYLYDRTFSGEPNLSTVERIGSVGFGLILAAGGLSRGADLPGSLMALAGAALVARGMKGHCPVKAMMHGDGRLKSQDRYGQTGGGHPSDPANRRLAGPRSRSYEVDPI